MKHAMGLKRVYAAAGDCPGNYDCFFWLIEMIRVSETQTGINATSMQHVKGMYHFNRSAWGKYERHNSLMNYFSNVCVLRQVRAWLTAAAAMWVVVSNGVETTQTKLRGE